MKLLCAYASFSIKTLAYSAPMLLILLGINIIPAVLENYFLERYILSNTWHLVIDSIKLWSFFVFILFSVTSIIFWTGVGPVRKS